MTPGNRRSGWVGRLYAGVVRLLPRELRNDYGRDMLELFESRIEDATSQWEVAELTARGVADVLIQAASARLSAFGSSGVTASAGSLATDVRLSFRRLMRDPTTSAAAVLSLALAVGACTSAFRLVDGLLFRPLPVHEPQELYALSYRTTQPTEGPEGWDSGPYVMFEAMKSEVEPDARLFMASRTYRTTVRVGDAIHPESVYMQRLSGDAFSVLGTRPAVGRLLSAADDVTPGEHPVVVVTNDFWQRRFGGRSDVLGSTILMGSQPYEVVGVVDGSFTGTQTGRMADMFIPTMMGRDVRNPFQNGLSAYLRIDGEHDQSVVLAQLERSWIAFQEVRTAMISAWTAERRAHFLSETELVLNPASAGTSAVQEEFRRPLAALSVLVALVLLIASTNVANLLIVRAGRRRLDSAVRVSIGAGRGRLIQLALIESSLIAVVATAAGLALSAWAVPAVLRTLSETGDPVRLLLPFDGRLALFSFALTLGTAGLFGLAPAWWASKVHPIHALKGGSSGSISRRTPHALVAVQAAFCFLVLFGAGLFTATAKDLSQLGTGFRSDDVVALSVQARPAADAAAWREMADALSAVPGVRRVALAGWPLLDGSSSNAIIAYDGQEPNRDISTEILCVSPGWIDVMGVELMEGRDLRSDDRNPDVVLVNQAFVRTYAGRESVLDQSFEQVHFNGTRTRSRIVGVVTDVRYLNLRSSPPPAVYVPCESRSTDGTDQARGFGAFMIQAAGGDIESLSPALRETVADAGNGFVVSRTRTQNEINRRHTVRERLLASLGGFFALVALLLAGVGLYGVLHDSVQQRQRELSVRIALGSPAGGIAREVASRSFVWLAAGLLLGGAAAFPLYTVIQSLLYDVEALPISALALPAAVILMTGLAAASPGTVRALRTDPAQALRSE